MEQFDEQQKLNMLMDQLCMAAIGSGTKSIQEIKKEIKEA